MQDIIERLTKIIYRKRKKPSLRLNDLHPDEEVMVCLLEGRLSREEGERIKAHLIDCDICAERVAVQLKLKETDSVNLPDELIAAVKDLVKDKEENRLEIFLRLKEKTLELLHTTGDVLVGQELIPAPLLRSRKIRDFRDEVIIFKDVRDTRVEIKIENKESKVFNLIIAIKERLTQRLIRDLRVTLIRDDLELESYVSDSGKVVFENVPLGKYTIDVTSIDSKITSILLDIKI